MHNHLIVGLILMESLLFQARKRTSNYYSISQRFGLIASREPSKTPLESHYAPPK